MIRALAAALLVVAGFLAAGGTAVAQSGATVVITPDIIETGRTATVTIEGWTGETTVVAELCGNRAANGSSDCNLAGSAAAQVGANGTAVIRLPIDEAPTPCPCVVRVHGAKDSSTTITDEVVVLGLPTASTTTTAAAKPGGTSTSVLPSEDDAVPAGSASDERAGEADDSPWLLVGAAALVLAVGAGVVMPLHRRGRSTPDA